jgi:hypothetical protein
MLKAMADGDTARYDPSPYLAVLDGFEREELDRLRRIRTWYYGVTAGVFGATFIVHAFGLLAVPWWVYAALIGLALFTAVIIYRDSSLTSLRFYRWELYHSGLATTLALGEIGQRDIRDHTPAAFRGLYQPVARLSPKQHLRRIARYLHWYLVPPRRHLPELVFLLPAIPLILAAILLAGFQAFLTFEWYQTLCFLPIAALLVLMTICVDQVTYMAQALHLVQYLRAQWVYGKDTPAAEPRAPDPTIQLCLILNQLAHDLRVAALKPQLGLEILIVSLLCLFLMGLLTIASSGLIGPGGSWAIILLYLLLWFVVRQVEGWYYRQVKEQTRARLAQTDIAVRVAYGDLNYHDIEDHIPWPFAVALRFPRMPRGYADDLRRMVWRVAFNLDWYLGPPRRLLRASWLAVLLVLILVPAAIALMLVQRNGSTIMGGTWLSITLLAAAVVLIFRDTIRWQAWQHELVEHLRRRLVADRRTPGISAVETGTAGGAERQANN